MEIGDILKSIKSRLRLDNQLAPLVLIFLALGCSRPAGKESGQVSGQDFTSRFTGYKVIYMLNAPPKEVESYLREPRNLVMNSGMAEIVYVSGDNMEKLGDAAEFAIKAEIMSNLAPYKMVLAYQAPGEELWYLSEGERGRGLSLLRFKFKALNNGTKVTMIFEKQEEQDPFTRGLVEAANLSETIVRGADWGGARMQAHFDPSLSADKILEKGYRGELYDEFYQGHNLSVWINTAPEKVLQYLNGPKFAELEKQYQFDFSRCLLSEDREPFLSRTDLLGSENQIETFPGLRKPGDGYYSCYLIPSSVKLAARVQILLKSRREGTDLTITYITEAPETLSAESIHWSLLIGELPKALEQLLVQIKAGAENAASGN